MNAGIFGVAHVHAEAYVGNLRAAPGVEFVGASDSDSASLASWAERHDAPAFASEEALIEAGVDVGVVCTPTNDHRRTVETLAAAGIHVLCEKPLATSLEDSRAIVAACHDAGVMLMTAFPMRFSPALTAGADWILEGRIGRPIAIVGTNQGRIPTDHAAWFADAVAAGGGAVMDHTVHLADIMRWWLGAEPTEVFAETNAIIHPHVSVETSGLIMVAFDNGVFATIDCSWSRPDGYPTWGGLGVEVVGTDGVLTIDAFAQRLEVLSHGSVRMVDWGSDTNQLMINHFVGAARGEHAVAVTGEDGLRATEVALAAYRSVATSQPVAL